MKLTVLISSAGRRVGLLESFRRAAEYLSIDLTIVACDAAPELSAACHLADAAHKVPRCDAPGFVDAVLGLAERHGASLVVPTIDPELLPLAQARQRFEKVGVFLHVAPSDVIEVVRDKERTARRLAEVGVAVPRTASPADVRARPDDWSWPVFLKPRGGSASRGLKTVSKVDDLPPREDEPMIVQELLNGPEYTVNMFVDRQGHLKSVVPHRRLSIRAGEVEKGRTERGQLFTDLAAGIMRAFPGLTGASCFQLILDPRLGAKVFEINARFGGGYPLADRAGATFARWLLEQVAGLPSTANDDWREGNLDVALRCRRVRGRAVSEPHVIVFDLDDTLYVERDFALSGFRAASRWFEEQTGKARLDERCAELFASGERARIFDRALASLGHAHSDGLVAELVRVYRLHRPEIVLAPDAARFLARRVEGRRFALITDGHAPTQKAKISALGLERLLDRIVCTDEWGRHFWKPHTRAFEAIEAWSRLPPQRLVYVADNPAKDFVTPRARGWLTFQVDRAERVHPSGAPDEVHQAHATISDFDTLESGIASRWSPPQ